ncbi:hypothetical protein NGRA_0645 [Nosema granulosis]|uniref:Uncharacterized protein n=1 Tax=Nosema granulosis TaxID=83296 RepID=A0A9P6H2N6_9MICR|nr:hypothetical protein NGRA_0645 [Nosema granulosis]
MLLLLLIALQASSIGNVIKNKDCIVYNTICGNYIPTKNLNQYENELCNIIFNLIKSVFESNKDKMKRFPEIESSNNVNLFKLKDILRKIQILGIKIPTDEKAVRAYEKQHDIKKICDLLKMLVVEGKYKEEKFYNSQILFFQSRFFELELDPNVLLEMVLIEIRKENGLRILFPEMESFIMYLYSINSGENKSLYVQQLLRIASLVYFYHHSMEKRCLQHPRCISLIFSDFLIIQKNIFKNVENTPSETLIKQYIRFLETLNYLSVENKDVFYNYFNNYILVRSTFPFLIVSKFTFLGKIFSCVKFDLKIRENISLYEHYLTLKKLFGLLIY